jgi:diketogulonate reductase-like aldo/keto reductase
MRVADREIGGIGLGTAQFALGEGTALACAERDVAYLAYSPLGGPSAALPQAAHAVARRRGVSVQRVALAWLRGQSPDITPIVGASRPASIRDSATPWDLDAEDLAQLRPV